LAVIGFGNVSNIAHCLSTESWQVSIPERSYRREADMDEAAEGDGNGRWIALVVVMAVLPVIFFITTLSSNDSGGAFGVALIVLFIEVLYLLPTIVAVGRNTNSIATTILINLFLGWSLIGWVFAFVSAVGPTKKERAVYTSLLTQAAAPRPASAPTFSPDGSHYWHDGAWKPVPTASSPAQPAGSFEPPQDPPLTLPAAAEGFYPDPARRFAERYWTGSEWGSRVRSRPGGAEDMSRAPANLPPPVP
jgi:Superinfection immunity protein/Protein of unknown function (DUF2510)